MICEGIVRRNRGTVKSKARGPHALRPDVPGEILFSRCAKRHAERCDLDPIQHAFYADENEASGPAPCSCPSELPGATQESAEHRRFRQHRVSHFRGEGSTAKPAAAAH